MATSDERAALVDALATEIVDAEAAINDGNPVLLARRVVAWFEAAGWGPRPEPITYPEINDLGMRLFSLFGDMRHAFVPEIWDERAKTVLAALPERDRRLVLGE